MSCKKIVTTLTVLMVLFAFSGCQNIALPSIFGKDGSNSNSLLIVWNPEANGRTILPTGYPEPVTYDVELTAEGETTVTKTGLTLKSWSIAHLAPTLWTVTVTGRNASGDVVAIGSIPADLSLQATKTVQVVLRYIISGQGTGKIRLGIDLNDSPGHVDAISISLSDPDGIVTIKDLLPLTDGIASFVLEDAAVGSYRLYLKAESMSMAALKSESLLVIQATETTATIVFSSADFSDIYIPVTSVSVEPVTASIMAGSELVLSATVLPADASNASISWSSDHPEIASVDPVTGLVTAVSYSNGMEVTIRAVAIDGGSYSECRVTVVPNNSSEALAEAKALLKAKMYDEALVAFERSDSPEASLYKAALKIAAVSVHPSIVDAAKSCLGLVDYPSTMNELFDSGWLQGEYFIEKWDEAYYPAVAIPETNTIAQGYWVEYRIYDKTFLPTLDIPEKIAVLKDATEPGFTIDEYLVALIFNVLTRHPDGVNALMDKLDEGAFGADFETALGYLASVPDDAVISFDYAETSILPSWIPIGSVPPVKIGKAELLAEAASLRMMRSVFQWIKSYDFNFPYSSIIDAIDLRTGGFTAGISGPNPYESDFLTLRDPASLEQSKMGLSQALGDLMSAIALIQSRVASDDFDILPALIDPYIDLPQVSVILGQFKHAIDNGGSVFLPADPMGLVAGTEDLLPAANGEPEKLEVALSALFDLASPLLNFTELIESNDAKTAPVWYADLSRWDWQMVEVGPEIVTPITQTNALYVKIQLEAVLQKIIPSFTLPSVTYLPVSPLTQGDKLMAWFGQTWNPPAEIKVGGY